MPGKVNPVIPEAVAQAAIAVTGYDLMILQAVGGGNLELSQFLPLVADSLLGSLDLLTNACDIFARHCVTGIEADEDRCRQNVRNSTALLTALVDAIGYDAAEQLAAEAAAGSPTDIRQLAIDRGLLTAEQFDELTSPEHVMRLGTPGGNQPSQPCWRSL
jgi:aspartate ammonia-lyase